MAVVASPPKLPRPRSSPKVDWNNYKQPSLVQKLRINHLATHVIQTSQIFRSFTCTNTRISGVRTLLYATLNSPRGFGPPQKKTKRAKRSRPGNENNDEDEEDEEEEQDDDREAGVIPEIVTNRMMSRMAFTVGIPLFIGLLFFPFFYYLKVGLKVDVPTWLPLIVSFMFFGTALLGVSYGIVSSSWDPMREGSVLGWREAQKNWPVFWQSFWGRSGKR